MRHFHVWPSWLQDFFLSRWVEILRRVQWRQEERALCVCIENPSNRWCCGSSCKGTSVAAATRADYGDLCLSWESWRGERSGPTSLPRVREWSETHLLIKQKTEQTSLKVDWTQIKRTYELEDNTSSSDGALSDNVITSDSALADASCTPAFVSSPPVYFPLFTLISKLWKPSGGDGIDPPRL